MRIAVVGATGLVGGALTRAARREGHHVVALSRSMGRDVLSPTDLADALGGVDVVVDLVRSPSADETSASVFFARAARHLGKAAHRAGVLRTVVLSLIGSEAVSGSRGRAGTGTDGYYSAKFVHERATAFHSPGPRIVRSAPLHDLAVQLVDRPDGDGTVLVPDLLVQPVAVDAMVGVLLRVATDDGGPDVIEVAGPRPERLATLAAAVVAHRSSTVVVVPTTVGELVHHGILLPGVDAVVVGPDFARWLASQAPSAPAGGL